MMQYYNITGMHMLSNDTSKTLTYGYTCLVA